MRLGLGRGIETTPGPDRENLTKDTDGRSISNPRSGTHHLRTGRSTPAVGPRLADPLLRTPPTRRQPGGGRGSPGRPTHHLRHSAQCAVLPAAPRDRPQRQAGESGPVPEGVRGGSQAAHLQVHGRAPPVLRRGAPWVRGRGLRRAGRSGERAPLERTRTRPGPVATAAAGFSPAPRGGDLHLTVLQPAGQ